MGTTGKKHIHVSCAIIEHQGLVLATQRSATMSLALKWEFPGGKIEAGESAEECLHRELMEELGISTTITRSLPACCHTYPDFTITLYPFVCSSLSGEIILNEHASLAWVEPDKLTTLDWAEADWPILMAYLCS